MILVLRTDKPESEIGLYDGKNQLVYETWHAHRQLAETIHAKIQDALKSQNKQPEDITGVVIYKGPGSFTGLRIGMSVANALAYSQSIPVVATTGENWITSGIVEVQNDREHKYAVPEYGETAITTKPKK